MAGTYPERLETTAALLRQARTVVAFTGAGISTESGLIDFRSPGGLWERYRIVTFQEFLDSEAARAEYWRMRRELIPALIAARPNAAHGALAELQRLGKLQAVITQNIDGLHQAAGSTEVIELHGTNLRASCLSCGRSWPIAAVQARLEAGEAVPRCADCGGLIKPDTVSFGQNLPEPALAEAFAWAQRSELLLVVGSSLEVQPAAKVPLAAAAAGSRLVFINRTATPYDQLATACFTEDAGRVLSDLVRCLAPGGGSSDA